MSLWVALASTSALASPPPVDAPPPVDERPPVAEPPPSPRPIDEHLVLTRVVPDDNRIAARLGAELDVIGLEAEWIDIPAQAPPLGQDLIDYATAAGASAAIEIIVGETRVEVWVADVNTGKTLTRRFDLALDPAQGKPRTLAIAAVELLRASRLEGEVDVAGELEDRAQATDDERAPMPERPSTTIPLRGALSLAPVLGGSPGGYGFTGQIEVAGRWAPPRRMYGLRVSLWLPTLGNHVSDPVLGTARVLMLMGFIEPQLRLPGGVHWFHPELGLGLGAAVTIIQGQAASPYRSNQQVLPGFVAYGHLGFGFAVSQRVWLRIDGYGGFIQPQPRVKFVETVVARWGLPFGMGSLGAEVWF